MPHDNAPEQSRVIGALLALHSGDSLGSTVEFRSHASIKKRYPDGLRDIIGGGPFSWAPGHATDDTDMTRGILLAYRDHQQQRPLTGFTNSSPSVVQRAAEHFLCWLRGDWPGRELDSRPEDIGNATFIGLSNYARTRDPSTSGAGRGSAGNGSLMRCLPTGLFQEDAARLVEESLAISKITHNDERCTIACAAYNVIISHLIRGVSPKEAIQAALDLSSDFEDSPSGPVSKAIALGTTVSLRDVAEKGPDAETFLDRCGGYVLDTLTLAIAALLDDRSLEDVLVDVVRVGNDTDTNGAVAGGLLGAKHGESAIPERWSRELQFGQEFREIALQIMGTSKK